MISINSVILSVTILYCVLFSLYYKKISGLLNIYDYPDGIRKKHKNKIPIIGGIGLIGLIYLIYIFSIFDLYQFDSYLINKVRNLFSFYVTLTLFFLIGLYDDKYNLNPFYKLLNLSLVVVFFLTLNPDLLIKYLNFSVSDKVIELENFSFFFTIFCYLVFAQALNMFDGINAQCGLFSIFIFAFFYSCNQNILFLIIIIYLIFFIFLNLKNKMFLGDSGVYLLSFLISFFFIDLYNKNFFKTDQILILLLLPGLDLIRLFVFRIYNGKSPFAADRNHIHHYLMNKIGLNKTLFYFLIIYLFSFIFVFNNYITEGILLITLTYFLTNYYSKK